MPDDRQCPNCGGVLPPDAPAGLCVKCMLRIGIAQEAGVPVPPPSPAAPAAAHKPGDCIGPYKLVQQIGTGGMGIVWMAEQREPIRRIVALKIIKAGMDSGQVLARFEAERQALALMDHPNIAKVLDAGSTPQGRPYFVMELVKGIPLTKFCDEQRLSIRERLELFMPVCQAIQHAHQKGVIHRDISPGNVLVSLYDGRPVPKVIDFGIAKAIGQPLTERTLITEFGAIIGKLEYMSPEQAEFNQLDIDTRSDIYSLGVLLYELLTGSTPITREALRQSALDEVLRRIRETEPPKPSTRLSQSKERLASISAQRKLDPPHLTKLVRGDLDWIVMKALEKDRARRYESANGLIHDITRHLTMQTVLARPPTVAYRARTFIRRNRALVCGTAAVALVLLLGMGVSTWMWQRAELARAAALDKAEAEKRAKVEAQNARAAEKIAAEKERAARATADNALKAEVEQRRRAEYETYLAQISLAAAKIDNREFGPAEVLLDACPASYRHWEWGRLKRLCHAEIATIQAEPRLGSVALSEDAEKVFTFDKVQCTVWDSTSAQELAKFDWSSEKKKTQSGFVYGWAHFRELFFFPEKNRALLVSQNGSGSAFCDLINGVRISDLDFRDFPIVSCAALSPDGRMLLAGSQHAFVKMFDARTGKELVKLPVLGIEMPDRLGKGLGAVAFSPDGSRFLAAGSFAIQVWDTATHKELLRLNEDDPVTGRRPLKFNTLQRAWFSRDGRQIIGSGPETVRVWDAETGRETMRLGKERLGLRAFSSNGQRILTSSDKGLQLWAIADGRIVATMSGSAGKILRTHFSADERFIVAVGEDRKVRIWDASTGTNVAAIEGHQGAVNSAVVSVDGKQVLTASDDRTARLWDLETGRELMVFSGHSQPVTCAKFCPDGEGIVTISKDRSAKTWSTRGTHQALQLRVAAGTLGPGTFSPNGKLILTCDATAPLRRSREANLWDAKTGRRLHRLPLAPASVRSAHFTPDGKLIVVKGWTRSPLDGSGPHQRVGLWETETGKLVTTLAEMTNAWETADLSHDGRWFFGANGTNAAVWDVKTGQRVSTLKEFKHQLGRAAFSPDGNRLMTSFDYGYDEGRIDKTVEEDRSKTATEFPYVKMWDPSNGLEVCAVKFFQSSLKQPVFTPDSRYLLTFGFSTCHLWSLESGHEVRRFEEHNAIVSQDSKRIFGMTYAYKLSIFDLESGNSLVSGPGHREEAQVTSISSDGKRFLTSSVDGTAKLWDAATARELLTFKTTVGCHSYPVFSPDDRQILITIAGTVVIFDTTDWKNQSPDSLHE